MIRLVFLLIAHLALTLSAFGQNFSLSEDSRTICSLAVGQDHNIRIQNIWNQLGGKPSSDKDYRNLINHKAN